MRSLINSLPYIGVLSLVGVVMSACGSDASNPPAQGQQGAGGAGVTPSAGGAGVTPSAGGAGVTPGAGGAGVTPGAGGAQTGAGGAQTGAGGAQTGAGGAQAGAGGGSTGTCDVAKAKTLITSVDSTLQTSDACAACLCSKCATETANIEGDTKAIALLACGKKNNCNSDCCFCGAICDSQGANYRKGPCAAETEAAAGLPTPSNALFNGGALKTACTAPPTPTSCSKPTDVATCIHTNCEASCGAIPACM